MRERELDDEEYERRRRWPPRLLSLSRDLSRPPPAAAPARPPTPRAARACSPSDLRRSRGGLSDADDK